MIDIAALKRIRNRILRTGSNIALPFARRLGLQTRPVGYFPCVLEWSQSGFRDTGESYLEYESPHAQDYAVTDKLLRSPLGDIFAQTQPGTTTRQFRLLLRNARVIGSSGTIVHNSNRIFSELSYDYATEPKDFAIWNKICVLPVNRRLESIGVAHSRSADNYSHWLLEVVPQLLKLKEDLDAFRIDAIYVRCEEDYQRDWFEMLGIDVTKLIPANDATHIAAEKMVVYSMPMRNCEFSRSQLEVFKSLVRPEWRQEPNKKLFIGREGGARSLSLIDGDIRQVVEDCGYKYVLLEEYSPEQKIRLFAESSVIAGPHGGGMGNIVFSAKGTVFKEIHSPLVPNLCYWRIAASMPMIYEPILAVVKSNFGVTLNKNRSMQLSANSLREFLQ
jgi:hypothetical protein